jgi:prepilin-type N-terminal cleavage/methylation domain-containing protein
MDRKRWSGLKTTKRMSVANRQDVFMRMNTKNRRQQGFSLIELMIVMLVLTIIMGAIFQQLDMVQKRYRSEQNKLDLFQNSREFVDQFARDVHQAGFPNTKLFALNAFSGPREKSAYNANGLIFIDRDFMWFEGDVNGDGIVDSVAYYLEANTTNAGNSKCPCLKRSQVPKADGVAPMDNVITPQTQVENVVIPNYAGGDAFFYAYDKEGTPIDISAGLTRTDFTPNTTDMIYKIYMVRIRLNVKASAAAGDIGTGFRPQVFITAGAQVNN